MNGTYLGDELVDGRLLLDPNGDRQEALGRPLFLFSGVAAQQRLHLEAGLVPHDAPWQHFAPRRPAALLAVILQCIRSKFSVRISYLHCRIAEAGAGRARLTSQLLPRRSPAGGAVSLAADGSTACDLGRRSSSSISIDEYRFCRNNIDTHTDILCYPSTIECRTAEQGIAPRPHCDRAS